MAAAAPSATLPPLREELSLHPGPAGADGWPCWILRDPVRNRFFHIDWPGFEILARWSLRDPEKIAAAVTAETTLEIEPEDVAGLAHFLTLGNLLSVTAPEATAALNRAAQAERPSAWRWLLHHYLFFRIPLVRPDRFLSRTAPLVEWLGSTSFRLATLAALLVGLTLLGRQWDRFTATLLDTFTLTGAATYGVALVFAKVAHELSHAYTAKRLGCRVPTMGIAFLVMWPVLYTDVNEAWLLRRRRHRLMVGAAGVAAELTLAAWATLAWGLLADGPARQAAFVLATTTWISSVLINMSPFMRFDGYFLAMDTLNLPNLHPRSFALARWHLRETLFGLGEEAPEQFTPGTRRGLILFAWCVWLYRLVLFLGIAVLVYHFFIKAVGIVLFAVEMGWFVMRPFWLELKEWRRRGPALLAGRRGRISALLAAAALVSLVVPWPTGISAPALLQAPHHLSLYPPVPARIDSIAASNGQHVTTGQVLFTLSAPDLTQRHDQAVRRMAILTQILGGSGFDPALQNTIQSLREELQAAMAERLTTEREAERLIVTAPTDGVVTDLAPDLKPGQWLSPKDKLASVLAGDHAMLMAYVGEDSIDSLSPGAGGRFVATPAGYGTITATITAMERTTLRHLDAAPLASLAGGPIAVRSSDHNLIPEQALYRVRLDTTAPLPAAELPGTVRLEASGTSVAANLWRQLTRLVMRETGM